MVIGHCNAAGVNDKAGTAPRLERWPRFGWVTKATHGFDLNDRLLGVGETLHCIGGRCCGQ